MITIQKVQLSEADALLAFSKETFYEFFAGWNEPANMEAYSAVAFTPQKMLSELSNPNSEFYFALDEDIIVGYIKLNFNDAQTDLQDKNALEVERIYVSGKYHGKYIGKQLLDFTIEIANRKQFNYVWLGVWEHNEKAIVFYKRNGFETFGSHDFMLGDDKQTDLLMKKSLD
jgi:ribosomal protein S18 acetylase RimI-like enzyme